MASPGTVENHRRLLRLEESLAKIVRQAYGRARVDIVAALMERFERFGADPTPDQIRGLAREVGLIREIETRLSELGLELSEEVRGELSDAQTLALEAVTNEVDRLAEALGIDASVATGIDPAFPIILDTALEPVDAMVPQFSGQLRSQLLTSLARGDGVRTIVRDLLALNPTEDGVSLFRNGRNSAELMVRRTVIEVNNASRQVLYERAQEDIPGLKKQAVAVIQDRTTETCLKVHGQIQEVDGLYNLTGRPRFKKKMSHPPFHWNCRSSSVAYHPQFEEGTRLTTEAMREAARAELEDRETGK